MRDFGATATKLVDILTNDFAGREVVSRMVDIPGYVESLVRAESACELDERRFDELTEEFLAPLAAMSVSYEASRQEGEGARAGEGSGPGEGAGIPSSHAFRPSELVACSECPGDLTLRVFQLLDQSTLELLRAHHARIAQATSVTIDLESCSEGTLGNAFCLLALLFSRETNLRDLMGPQRVLSLYTLRNARYRLEQLARLLPHADTASRAQLEREAVHIQECARRGWVEEAEYYEALACPPAPEGMRVTVRVGAQTAGAAEQVALILRQAERSGVAHARLVGEPSGRAAFENVLRVPLDDRSWIAYPMTKACDAEGNASSAL